MGRVDGKVALVTGGGSGIGRGSAQALAAEGARVVVTDVDDAGGAETVKSIEAAGGQARYLHQDVTEEPRWRDVIEDIRSQEGRLDVLLNNAGIGIGVSVTEMTLEDWRRQTAVNLDGVFLGTKHAIPLMAESGGGSMINLSSVAGLGGFPGLAGYCATKGGVRLFTKAVALECAGAKNGIRVNSIHPGVIDTAIWTKIDQGGLATMREFAGTAGANAIDPHKLAVMAPLGVAGAPADIGAGVVFLASDESRYMTGSELVIDGGMTAA